MCRNGATKNKKIAETTTEKNKRIVKGQPSGDTRKGKKVEVAEIRISCDSENRTFTAVNAFRQHR